MKRINIFGTFFGYGGYQIHTREFALALNRLAEVTINPLDYFFLAAPPGMELNPELKKMSARREEIDVKNDPSICINYGDKMQFFSGARRIGWTVFEGTVLPAEWVNGLKQLDQIWVPSGWGREILIKNNLPAEKIKVVPEGVNPEIFRPEAAPLAKYHSENFKFLFVSKLEVRKGLLETLQAFTAEFKPEEKVELLVKLRFNPFDNFDYRKMLDRLKKPDGPKITLVEEILTPEKMAGLYQTADCLVSPTRAEAWGLHIIEALACGTPVIVTGYSGLTEYVSQENAYLIEVEKFGEIYDPGYFPEKGKWGAWAEPSVSSLRKQMRYVFGNRQAARTLGLEASRKIREKFSWDNSARLAYNLLSC